MTTPFFLIETKVEDGCYARLEASFGRSWKAKCSRGGIAMFWRHDRLHIETIDKLCLVLDVSLGFTWLLAAVYCKKGVFIDDP